MSYLKEKKRVVVKLGTSTLTHRTGRLNIRRVEGLVKNLADYIHGDEPQAQTVRNGLATVPFI